MKKIFLIGILLILSNQALAIEQSSFIYSKTILKIAPRTISEPPKNPESAKDSDKKKDEAGAVIDPSTLMPPIINRTTKEFTVEVRQPEFLSQKDFITHQPFSDKEGMMILIDPPAQAELTGTRIIASADVLFVDADGYIIKIAPSLNLANLSETIDSGKPIHAFVYLKSGTTVTSDIQLGDHIENTFFKTHPVIIQ